MKRLFLGVLLALMSAPSVGQATNFYDDDLTRLSGDLGSIMLRVSQMSPERRSSDREIREELLSLSKKLHRIDENAMSTDLQLMRHGQPSNRDLAYAAAVTEQLDAAQAMVGHYIDVGDPAFWSAAQSAARTARELSAAR